MRCQLLVTFGMVSALALGCGAGRPKTYPVAGKVAVKGKAALPRQLIGGKVRCQASADPGVVAVGSLEDDGSFTLGAFVKDAPLPGVPAGAYKVRVEPRGPDDDNEPLRPTIAAKYLDYDKSGLTFNVPVTGDLYFELQPR